MDRYDRAILQELSDDGRMSWAQMADRVNLSASACQRRVQALVNRGIIDKFTIRLNEKAQGHHVKAFVAVNIERQNVTAAEVFREYVQSEPRIQAGHMLSGDVDYLLEVVAVDLDALGHFIEDELLSFPAVKDASSSIVLKVVKPFQDAIGPA